MCQFLLRTFVWSLRIALLISACLVGYARLEAAAAGGRQAWELEWERVAAAAKTEGRVVVYGGPGFDREKIYKHSFEEAFPEIKVDYVVMPSSLSNVRISAERRAGKYIPDIHLGAAGSLYRTLESQNAFRPIELALILPEVLDAGKWFEGKHWYMDDAGKFIFTYSLAASTMVGVNTGIVNPKELVSYKDLLDPKWRGKIVSQDIRQSGPGSGNARFLYASPKLGPEFLRKLYTADVTLSRNQSQMVDWLAQGRFALMLFPNLNEIDRSRRVGMSVEIVNPKQMKEGYAVTAGFNSILLMNPTPHPNAARLYINWLLSRATQTTFEKILETPSLRKDTLSKTALRQFLVPEEGTDYMVVSLQKYEDLYNEGVQPIVKEAIAGR